MLKNSIKKLVAFACAGTMLLQASAFVLADENSVVYYDDDFSGFTAGSIVNLKKGSNTDYEGYIFTCGERASGGTDEVSVRAIPDGDKKYLTMQATSYAATRSPYITLTKTAEAIFSNDVVVKMRAKFATANEEHDAIYLDDSSGNTVSYYPTDSGLVDEWLDLEIVTEDGSNAFIVVRKDEEIVEFKQAENALKNLKTIRVFTVPDKATFGVQPVSFGDLYVADEDYVLADDVVIRATKAALTVDTTQETISGTDAKYTAFDSFELPTVSTGATVKWSVQQAEKDTDEWTDSTFAKISNGNVEINSTDEVNNYDFRLVANIKYNAEEDEKIIPLTITAPSDVVKNAVASVLLKKGDGTNTVLKPVDGVYNVDVNLLLATGTEFVPITWQCYKADGTTTNIITPEGILLPADYTDEMKLVATAKFNGAEATKEFAVKTYSAVEKYIDPAIAEMKFVSADDESVEYDIANIGTVHNDIKLPTVISTVAGEEIPGSIKVTWKALTDNITITGDGVAQFMTADYNEHDAEIEGTFTYVKNTVATVSKTPDSYKYKVVFTEEDVKSDATPGKYRVRFDSAYTDNFKNIPASTSSNITLPTTGKFGATITWSSDAPGIISASGKYTQPVNSRNIVLTATITAPDTKETGKYSTTVSVIGKGTTSSGGSGGGSSSGSTSSQISGTAIASGPSATNGKPAATSAPQNNEPAQTKGFTDLGSVEWAAEAINGLAAKGVITGKTDTTFAPNDNVTRAEFAKILVGAFGLSDVEATADFTDVSKDDWFYNYVAVAYRMGVINGYEDGSFGANDLITRQDMAVMVSRAAAVTQTALPEVNAAVEFEDADQIADYAKEAVSSLQKAGIINGTSETTFSPLDNATRAQAAKILYNFCK